MLKTIDSIPFVDEYGETKETARQFKDIILDSEMKGKTYDKKSIQSKDLYSSQLRGIGSPRAKDSFAADRRDVVISPKSIRSPQSSAMSKRKLKLTASDKKQINKDLKIFKNTGKREDYEESYDDEFEQDPAAANLIKAAEMGIDYMPAYERQTESNEAKEINRGKFVHLTR